MRDTVSRLAAALVATTLAGGCAEFDPIVASPDDYDHYREIRLEGTFLGRLAAAWRYLKTQPEGAFRPEVERWFQRADERFLLRHWDDVSNLDRYTRALPDAPRTGLASARMAVLGELRDRVAREEAEFLEQEAQRQKDLDAAKEARGTFIRTLLGWTQLEVTSRDFGKPPEAWSQDFRSPYFDDPPQATCDAERCRKSLLASFEIPRLHGLETRAASYTLTAHLHAGNLRELELAGPALFDRIAEAATARPSDPGDLQARAESIGVAAQLLSMTLAVGFSDPACEQDAISPVVLARACNGRSAYVIAAEDESQEDRIVVTVE
jgi:hypothetical protein